MLAIKKMTTDAGEHLEKEEPHSLLMGGQTDTVTMEISMIFFPLRNLKIELPHDTAIPSLDTKKTEYLIKKIIAHLVHGC